MGQMDPRRAQFNRSSTLEITNSAALERPAGEVDDGGGAREYGAGAADSDDKDGSVVCSAAILCGEVKARREVLVRSAIFLKAASLRAAKIPSLMTQLPSFFPYAAFLLVLVLRIARVLFLIWFPN